jgi:hypothetical protein
MRTRLIVVGLAGLVCMGACADAPSRPNIQHPTRALFDEGNPPPPPITFSLAETCPNPQGCPSGEVPCPLGDGDCFIVKKLLVTLFRNPASTYASLAFLTNDVAVSDGAQVRETPHETTVQGTLMVRFQDTWLSVDMQSMHGSLLYTTATGARLFIMEANARLPNGQLYPRKFLFNLVL